MYLTINNINKTYGQVNVLCNLCLQVQANSTLSILGKSGCGKSTLLKIIAGIEKEDSGEIILKNNLVNDQKPGKRNIVYLFQEALLFPHLNVFENVAFGLRIRKIKNNLIEKEVGNLLEQLGIQTQVHKMPHQLSGGQKQRVAFGRALIINPPLLLLDEPFSSLDSETRENMQQLYKSVAAAYNITALFVTHDLKESLIMGDKFAYLHDGKLSVYENREQFISDKKTGVANEINFWNHL